MSKEIKNPPVGQSNRSVPWGLMGSSPTFVHLWLPLLMGLWTGISVQCENIHLSPHDDASLLPPPPSSIPFTHSLTQGVTAAAAPAAPLISRGAVSKCCERKNKTRWIQIINSVGWVNVHSLLQRVDDVCVRAHVPSPDGTERKEPPMDQTRRTRPITPKRLNSTLNVV